jgi:hypothetical protein
MEAKVQREGPPAGQNSLQEKPCQKIRQNGATNAILTIQNPSFYAEFQQVM